MAVNIIYTLIYFCKKDIINVKQNIIDFLKLVKNDKVAEVKEICYQTLN